MQYDYPMPMTEGRQLPRFNLREIDMPEVKTWEVGEKYYIVMKVEMLAKHSGKEMGMMQGNDGSKVEGEFQMLSIKKLGIEPVDAKSLESKEFQNVINKVKSGEY